MQRGAAGAPARRGATARPPACSRSGSARTGVITYLYFALASHNLEQGTTTASSSSLWSAVFITVSTLYRPVEQLLSRTIAERDARRASRSAQPLRVAATIQGALALALRRRCAGPARAARRRPAVGQRDPLLGPRRLGRSPTRASYFARGFFAGIRRFGLYVDADAVRIDRRAPASRSPSPSESPSGQTAIALGIVAAPLLSLIVVPFAFLRGARSASPPPDAGAEPAGGGLGGRSSRSPRAAGSPRAVLLIMFSEQTFLNAGPLLVTRDRGCRRGGVHLQRADDRPGAAAALPGRRDEPPPPPHAAALPRRRRRRARPSGSRSASTMLGDRGASPRSSALVVAGRRPGADADRVRRQVHLRPRRASLIVTAGMGLYLGAATLNQAALAQGQVRRAASAGSRARPASSSEPAADPRRRSAASRSASRVAALRSSARCSTCSTAVPHARADDVPRAGLAAGARGAARRRRRGRLASGP